jgi:UDP-N-acetylglucosamine acyltransferase
MITSTDNFIHPTAVIGQNVQMGTGNYIGPYCVIENVQIGNNNRFEAFCSIGSVAEHREFMILPQEIKYPVIIGNNNIFREFVTINSGTQRNTTIGDSIIMLAKSHVGHDAIIHNNVTLSCFSCVGGHAEVRQYTNMGLHSVVHQFVIVPHGIMLGMGAIVTKKAKLKSFCTYVGNPAQYLTINTHLLQKLGVEEVDKINKIYEQK